MGSEMCIRDRIYILPVLSFTFPYVSSSIARAGFPETGNFVTYWKTSFGAPGISEVKDNRGMSNCV